MTREWLVLRVGRPEKSKKQRRNPFLFEELVKKSGLHINLPKRRLMVRRVHQRAKNSSSLGVGGDTQEVSVSKVSGVRVTLTCNQAQADHKDFLSSGLSQHLMFIRLVRTKSQSEQRERSSGDFPPGSCLEKSN